MIHRSLHFCNHCETDFYVPEVETGDFFLVCPECLWMHYRRFERGTAVHCDLAARRNEPLVLNGSRTPRKGFY